MNNKRSWHVVLSWFLAAVMVFSTAIPAFAEIDSVDVMTSLRIVVEDDNTSEGIPGNGIIITNKDTGVKYEDVTDEDGEVYFPSLPIGRYTFTDSSPAKGWQTASTKTFTLEEDVDFTLSVKKKKMAAQVTLTVESQDSDDSSIKIAGIKFGLYDSNDTLIKDITTGSGGSVNAGLLDEGDYYLLQKTTIDGYLLDDEPTEFTLAIPTDKEYSSYAVLVSVKIYKDEISENEEKTGTAAIKMKTTDGTPIINTGFTLYKTNGNSVVGIYTTDSAGEIEVTGLTQDKYYFLITDLPDYVSFDTTEKFSFELKYPTLKYTHTITAQILDEITSGSLTVIVTDQSSKDAVAGVTLEVFGPGGGSLGTKVTDTNGQVVYDEIDLGRYTIREVSVPDSYTLSADTQVAVLTQEKPVFKLELQKIKKQDAKGSLNVVVVDQEDYAKIISKATFALYTSSGVLVGDYSTDENGTFNVSELDKGEYYLKEVSMPTGYPLNKDKQYDFKLTELLITSNLTIQKLSNESITNSGALIVTVIDQTDNSKPVVGATFTLLRDGIIFGTYKTGNEGAFEVKNIPLGTYQLSESTMPYGYIISKSKTEVNLTSSNPEFKLKLQKLYQDTSGDGGNSGTGDDGQGNGETELKGSVNVTVVDKETKIKLPGAIIELYSEDGTLLAAETADSNGYVSFLELVLAKYYFMERTMPSGYTASSEKHSIDLNKFNVYNVTLEKVNTSGSGNDGSEATKGTIIVTFKDSKTNMTLAGISIDMFKEDGSKIGSRTTDGTGSVSFENIDLGTYYCVETIVPAGYSIYTEKRTISITESIPEFELTVMKANKGFGGNDTTKAGTITVTVVDPKKGTKLSGAVMELYKADGTIVSSYITDSQGKIVIESLSLEEYYLMEVSMPSGYEVSDNKYVIPLNSEIATYTFTLQKYEKNISDATKKYGSLTVNILRQDKETVKVNGATFGLYNADGTKVASYTVNNSGSITISYVPYGSYYILEETMPTGYSLSTAKHEFTLSDTLVHYTLTIKKVYTSSSTGTGGSSGGSGGSSGGGGSSSSSSSSSTTTIAGPGTASGPSQKEPVSDGNWKQEADGSWWYQYNNDSYPQNKWEYITTSNGSAVWYYFNSQGYMYTGWLNAAGSWYYLNADGSLTTDSWYFDGTNWYYFDTNGLMLTGWIFVEERWYYLNTVSDGTKGAMQTGWVELSGKSYYLNPVSDGTKGAMYADTMTPDGYHLNKDGVRE